MCACTAVSSSSGGRVAGGVLHPTFLFVGQYLQMHLPAKGFRVRAANGILASQQCWSQAHLVAEQGVHVGGIVAAPQLDSAVKGTAVKFVRARAESQPGYGISVSWQALHAYGCEPGAHTATHLQLLRHASF